MLRVGDEYTDLATTSAPKAIDLACGRHPGHLSDAAEDATSDSYFKAVATCGDGSGSELRRSSRRREPFRLRAQAPDRFGFVATKATFLLHDVLTA